MTRTIPHSLTRDADRLAVALRVSVRATTLLCAQAIFVVSSAQGDSLRGPIASRNLSPIYQHLGIPVLRSAHNPQRGDWSGEADLHWASHALRERSGSSVLEFDGETRRYDLTVALGLGAGFAFTANIPYVEHSAGNLDSLIDGWHSLWGLPEGARPQQPQDELLFSLMVLGRGADLGIVWYVFKS